MSEIHSILAVVSRRSLILLDEICRGTETVKGTCLAGSFVERLDDVGCLGIVSTHLHDIFDLPLILKNTIYMAMGSEVVDGFTKPTWKLMDGICRESLAFETAKKEGIPEKITKRAEELYRLYPTIDVYSQTIGERSKQEYLISENAMINSPSFSCTEMLKSPEILQKGVENAIMEVCHVMFLELHKKKSITKLPSINCIYIGAREQPPPSTIGTSSVYVLFRADNKLYIGQVWLHFLFISISLTLFSAYIIHNLYVTSCSPMIS